MDIKQAHDYMEDEIRCVQRAANGICDRDCKKCDLVKNDKELIEAYSLAILALEKQTSKNAVKVDVQPYFRKHFADKYVCPVCHKELKKDWKCCPYCTQVINF